MSFYRDKEMHEKFDRIIELLEALIVMESGTLCRGEIKAIANQMVQL